jgi:hypothetical protein
VGTGKGNAYYFGFRPRDDQSGSLGYETRTLFEILDHVGAYAPTGAFSGVNDNTEHVSRTSNYLTTRFPNGATVVVRHYNSHRETWEGGFSRNPEADAAALEANPLPSDEISLENFKVNGHEVSFDGTLTMAFRMNDQNELIAFEGQNCTEVEIDGQVFKFSETPLKKIVFAPSRTILSKYIEEGISAQATLNNDEKESQNELQIFIQGESKVSIPITKEVASKKLILTDTKGNKVKFKKSGEMIRIDLSDKPGGKWLTLGWD